MPRGVYERKSDRYPRLKPARPRVPCSAPGCDRIANRPRVGLCEKHYARKRANGTFEKSRVRQPFYVDGGGYHRVRAPGHPAAGVNGDALLHRVVFYDAHGGGPFPCRWCGTTVTWAEMHVDHVNAVPSDNRLENLVASCPTCNMSRGQSKSIAANRARGAQLTLNGETRALGEWAEMLGIDKNSLKWRLANGWPVQRALTEPRGKFGPRSAR